MEFFGGTHVGADDVGLLTGGRMVGGRVGSGRDPWSRGRSSRRWLRWLLCDADIGRSKLSTERIVSSGLANGMVRDCEVAGGWMFGRRAWRSTATVLERVMGFRDP